MDSLTQLAIDANSDPSKMEELMLAAFELMNSWPLPEPADPSISTEDIISEFLIALPKVVNRFASRNSGMSFASFLRGDVNWAIRNSNTKFFRRKGLIEKLIEAAIDRHGYPSSQDDTDPDAEPFNANTFNIAI